MTERKLLALYLVAFLAVAVLSGGATSAWLSDTEGATGSVVADVPAGNVPAGGGNNAPASGNVPADGGSSGGGNAGNTPDEGGSPNLLATAPTVDARAAAATRWSRD